MQQFQSGHGDAAGDPLTAGEFGLITRDLARSTGAGQVLLAVRDGEEGTADLVSAWSHNGSDPRQPRPASATRLRWPRARIGDARLSNRSTASDPDLCGRRSDPRRGHHGLGALGAAFASVPPDKRYALWVVESYARLAALCLHDPCVLDGLLTAARRDALTGCLSYGALRHELNREIARAARHGREPVLLLHRPRPLQAGERPLRPPPREPRAGQRCRRARVRHAGRGQAGPLRR